ncbi:hypothetical protein KSZ_25670 [Dictyobacter formicarum]|uniref:Uncharacterized protein n=1 Tax=Dictyobacter formicarum TaxID=2778368 RepID=A0ABQ3VFS7_9CHLR|nr:hypothetical protein KSZ_25670 [Dictyobacter formicarum]
MISFSLPQLDSEEAKSTVFKCAVIKIDLLVITKLPAGRVWWFSGRRYGALFDGGDGVLFDTTGG